MGWLLVLGLKECLVECATVFFKSEVILLKVASLLRHTQNTQTIGHFVLGLNFHMSLSILCMFQQRKALKPSYLPMFLSSLYRLRVQIMHGFKILIQPLRGVQLEQTIWKIGTRQKRISYFLKFVAMNSTDFIFLYTQLDYMFKFLTVS